MEKFGVDTLPIVVEPEWKEWKLSDGSMGKISAEILKNIKVVDGERFIIDDHGDTTAKMPKNGFYFDVVNHPLEKARSIEDLENGIEKFESEYMLSKELLLKFENRAGELYKNTDFALIADDMGTIYEQAQNLRGWTRFLMDLVSNPEFAEYLMDRLVEVNIKRAEKYLEAVGEYAQVVQVGDDLGLQDRMQISPEMYRKRVKPRHRELYKFIKEHSDAYLMLHSCGSIYPIIQDLIEIGVDALNPVQISAKDMDSKKLKSEFGRELTFWGGGAILNQSYHAAP